MIKNYCRMEIVKKYSHNSSSNNCNKINSNKCMIYLLRKILSNLSKCNSSNSSSRARGKSSSKIIIIVIVIIII